MSLIDESLLAPPATHRQVPALPVLDASDAADDAFLYERIAAHFHGAEIPADGGQLRISRQPQIMDGYQDGARYRVPVSIRYRLIA